MRFAIFDHAGKSGYLRQRLLEAEHSVADGPDDAELILLDCDWPWAPPRLGLIEAATDLGIPVALYPHGGMPTVFNYDGLCQPDSRVQLRLEHGSGSLDLAVAFGMNGELRQEAVGWLYCPTEPFKPVAKIRRLLFAPTHPNMETLGRMNGHDPAPRMNQQVYRDLLDLRFDELVVSIVGPPHLSGVWRHPRAGLVRNDKMLFPHTYELIRRCDAVIASGTVAAAAVALGKPTVMIGRWEWADYIGGEYRHADHADTYTGVADYPLVTGDAPLGDLLDRACVGDEATAGWRERWVGDDGTQKAVQLLEELVGETEADTPRHVMIQGARAGAGATGG